MAGLRCKACRGLSTGSLSQAFIDGTGTVLVVKRAVWGDLNLAVSGAKGQSLVQRHTAETGKHDESGSRPCFYTFPLLLHDGHILNSPFFV
jgi:hypothetical protein